MCTAILKELGVRVQEVYSQVKTVTTTRPMIGVAWILPSIVNSWIITRLLISIYRALNTTPMIGR